MTRIEIQVEAVNLNAEENKAAKARIEEYRRHRQQQQQNQEAGTVASDAPAPEARTLKKKKKDVAIPESLQPSLRAQPLSRPPSQSSYCNFVPIDVLPPSAYLPQKAKNPSKTKAMKAKSPKKKSTMPVTKIGVSPPQKSTPPNPSSPKQASPLHSYLSWKQQHHQKNLPKVWKQTDTLNVEGDGSESCETESDAESDEEETKIELPQNLMEREIFVYAAQKRGAKVGKIETASDSDKLIPVTPSLEKWPHNSTSASESSSLNATLVNFS